jgi:hypothetical protein
MNTIYEYTLGVLTRLQYPNSVDLSVSPFKICLSMRQAAMMRSRALLTVGLSSEDLISRVRQSGQVEFCISVNIQQATMSTIRHSPYHVSRSKGWFGAVSADVQ